MEYVVGPVIALLMGMKFTDWKARAAEKRIAALEDSIQLVSAKVDAVDTVILPKVMQTLQPVTRAVVRINEEIGIQ